VSAARSVKVGEIELGGRRELLLIAGPCVLEEPDEMFRTARTLAELTAELGVPFVFKSSFLKDNRTRGDSPRGPGIEEGLRLLSAIKAEIGCPVLTDVHLPEEIAQAAEVADILQIPAFLSRQSRLLEAAAASGRCVNVKKAQFMAAEDLAHVVDKLVESGCENILLTERGTCFGYHNLVVDFRGFAVAHELGWPWIFDVTHSLQQPSAQGGISGGTPAMAPLMARAAVAAGVQGLFLEAHPEPSRAWSDPATQLPLDSLRSWLPQVVELHRHLWLRSN
jgi:2-dehydro-3-deoxyphosphooctonate aldolase (KDO 8-P synthase)